ncbi:acyltransferase [Chimaeribacter arupi]|uniref:acyltransferase n=1 Tax=Chimaeribacter arupi TaxID=2060066 RepID=UPI002711E6D6|nr:acyltransferase [Chimaeribacter arupi]WKZ93749.1 acyltransferase [Chimaeribacter arupi]
MSAIYFILLMVKDALKYLSHLGFRAKMRANRVRIDSSASVFVGPDNVLTLKPGVSVGKGSVITCSDEMAKKGVRSRIVVGEDTAINEYNNIRASGGEIIIGKKCIISQYVSMIASNHEINTTEYMKDALWDNVKTSVTIGDDVWIGAGAVILPGVRVGNGCVIASGAVVTKNVPDFSIVAGVPAKVVSQRPIHA